MEGIQKEVIEIKLENWVHECADGCCTTYGTDVFVNGEKLDGDASEAHGALFTVLTHLGYLVEIEFI